MGQKKIKRKLDNILNWIKRQTKHIKNLWDVIKVALNFIALNAWKKPRWQGQESRINEGIRNILEVMDYVYYPDWGDDFTCMYIYIQTYQIMYFKYVPFVVYQLYLSKTVSNRHVASGYIIGQCSSKATTKRKLEECIINKLVKG